MNYKKNFETKILNERKKAKNKAKNIMKIVMDQQILKDFSVCFDKRLEGFIRNDYALNLCKKYFGESGYKTCNQRPNFCDQCCDFNIGVNYPDKKINCLEKCTQIIQGNKDILVSGKNKKGGEDKINETLKKKLGSSNEIREYLKKKLFNNENKKNLNNQPNNFYDQESNYQNYHKKRLFENENNKNLLSEHNNFHDQESNYQIYHKKRLFENENDQN